MACSKLTITDCKLKFPTYLLNPEAACILENNFTLKEIFGYALDNEESVLKCCSLDPRILQAIGEVIKPAFLYIIEKSMNLSRSCRANITRCIVPDYEDSDHNINYAKMAIYVKNVVKMAQYVRFCDDCYELSQEI